MLDLLIRNARIAGQDALADIAVSAGLIAAIGPALQGPAREVTDAQGMFAFPGFADSHIHLDKADILGRCTICEGTLPEAIAQTARAKADFTAQDVYARAARLVERAILHGTTLMRSFVEVDPRIGFRALDALLRLREDYRFAIDIQLCAFAQEGLTQEPQTIDMLRDALRRGADMVGGCPYADPDPARHIATIFDIAGEFDVDVDFHLDFDLDPGHTNLPAVIAQTAARGWQGRVSIGHVTNLSAMPPAQVARIGRDLAQAGIALTVLPATDLFLTGRDRDRLVPRGIAPAHLMRGQGVLTSIATNNVLNPFTPFGDGSLLRMANLYANVAQLACDADMDAAFAMVAEDAARILRRDHGLCVGANADIVLLDCTDRAGAIRSLPRVAMGWKRGRRSFHNPAGQVIRADQPQAVFSVSGS
ncbi:amidohydrolase family protein [Paracoccus shanxieyensis]|uniref:Amidohydrolase family protein n=1 Tax=Paracoccus shanxieyensis TaxID=2675752 RepID=A0A6L6IYT3_9RHOB|nr:amidohydrolase family protein [Paracoccus shanxieyensis]MTH65656.1 amidohydrolase family protein [Paracoccus shanxieyensis]MTH88769.1 amidohydrolase family protein [Paracoccus shanxieyensis]